MSHNRALCVLVALLLAAPACTQQATGPAGEATQAPGGEPAAAAPGDADMAGASAEAVIRGPEGSSLKGSALFAEEDGQVALELHIEGVPPGTHAVHLHETGDCSAADFTSAGAHWNPTHEDHGRWGTPPHHAGDIGNLEVGEDGMVHFHMETDAWSLGTGAENDVVGKSVIIHEKADDFTTQPTGAAGGRIGCGVVELLK